MQQSNALRRLGVVLSEAFENGAVDQPAGSVLLKAMELSVDDFNNIIDFYGLLNKAREEAQKMKNMPNIKRDIDALDNLSKIIVTHPIFSTQWQILVTYIGNGNYLSVLNSLANSFHARNPTIFLEREFLENLNREFNSLLDEIISSESSKELKSFLVERIGDILTAIQRYHVDGTEGLEKAIKLLVSNLVIGEHSLNNEDKKSPFFRKSMAFFTSLLIYITPSPYDIIGTVPALEEYWIPKWAELVEGRKKIEMIVDDSSTFQEVFEKAPIIFTRQAQRMIAEREILSLPAPRKEPEAATD
jgi:hypothetical protein